MKQANKVYKVAPGRIASSRADGKDYHEGETIDLSHCTPAEISNLIAIGLVVEEDASANAKSVAAAEVTNG